MGVSDTQRLPAATSGSTASRSAAATIAAVTERVVGTAYPVALLAAADGSGFAAFVRSPAGDVTRLIERDGTVAHDLPGVVQARWHAGGFVRNAQAGLERWSWENDEPERLGRWPGRRVSAAVGPDLWLAGPDTLWRHAPDGSQALEVGLGARLLGDVAAAPDGGTVAVRVAEGDGSSSSLLALARDGVELRRWHERGWCMLAPSFAGAGRLVVTRMSRDSQRRQVAVLDLASGAMTELVSETSGKGFAPLPPAVAAGDTICYVRYVEGWPLVCVLDLLTGRERVVNPGRHEDLTDVHDEPAFSPSARFLAFNSSAAGLRERHLYTFDVAAGVLARRSEALGATGAKAWLGDEALVFVESDAGAGAALRLLLPDGSTIGVADALRGRGDASARSPGGRSAPRDPAEAAIKPRGREVPLPLPITVCTPDRAVPADLYLPGGIGAGQRRPALVYAHGGVFRQLTRGYPASYAYTLLHEINLGLVELGFVVMSVEYRGSMGFGLEHEQANHMACGVADTLDCAAAASYLAALPYVDPARIGIWGLSWGGTLTLQALVRHPKTFAAGVSLAGIWDFDQRARYWNELQAGQPIYFDGRMGSAFGTRERARASARELAGQLEAPLLSLHGTLDESVDYPQQLLLEADAARLGKSVETVTFPGEKHVFGTADAWRKAVPRILGFLLDNLGRQGSTGE